MSKTKVFVGILTLVGFFWTLVGGFHVAQGDFEVRVKAPSLGPKTKILVTNVTPFYAELIALDKIVAIVEPAATVRDERRFDFDHTELPLVVRLYRDKECLKYFVGIATVVLGIRRGDSVSWVIDESDIIYPDNRYSFLSSGFGYRSPYPAPRIGRDGKVEFPRIKYSSTTAIHFINATFFNVIIKIDGEKVSELYPEGIYYREMGNSYDQAAIHTVQVIFTDDDGKFYGYKMLKLSIENDGPHGIQIVIDPTDMTPY